jgi:hypothetical protein
VDQLYWLYAHILLLVFWLGADVGVYLSMIFIRDSRLDYRTRATIIRLAFYIDLAPRFAFALMIPVGIELARGIGLVTRSGGLRAAAWSVGLAWCALHATALLRKGSALAATMRRANVAFEAVAGAALSALGGAALAGFGPAWPPWFATKLLLFGLIFLVVLGIDTKFQPFTMLLSTGPAGPTAGQEAAIRRATDLTLAWALLLYALILAIAFLGKVKPI